MSGSNHTYTMATGSLGTALSEEQVNKSIKWMSGYSATGSQSWPEDCLQVANMARVTHGQAVNQLNWYKAKRTEAQGKAVW